jgi:hypothetical protein
MPLRRSRRRAMLRRVIDAHEAAEAAKAVPKKSSPAMRVLGHALAGLGAGAGSGAVGGGLFMLIYTPHGGGQIGDWTSLLVLAGMIIVGTPLGLIGGIASALSGFKLRWLLVSLGALALVACAVAFLANLH